MQLPMTVMREMENHTGVLPVRQMTVGSAWTGIPFSFWQTPRTLSPCTQTSKDWKETTTAGRITNVLPICAPSHSLECILNRCGAFMPIQLQIILFVFKLIVLVAHFRNPDGDDRPWCYFKNGDKLNWDYCKIKKCPEGHLTHTYSQHISSRICTLCSLFYAVSQSQALQSQ